MLPRAPPVESRCCVPCESAAGPAGFEPHGGLYDARETADRPTELHPEQTMHVFNRHALSDWRGCGR
jgi:hypothetical protein